DQAGHSLNGVRVDGGWLYQLNWTKLSARGHKDTNVNGEAFFDGVRDGFVNMLNVNTGDKRLLLSPVIQSSFTVHIPEGYVADQSQLNANRFRLHLKGHQDPLGL